MIPNRLMLRALTVLTLTRGGSGPYPTMAGEAVFDTRLEPITDIATEGMTPVILVYTDTDTRQNKDKNSKSVWGRKVALIIELAICSVRRDEKGTGSFEWLETSAEMEAMLDIFEMEVELAFADPTNVHAQQWSKMIKCFDTYESTPSRSAEQTTRYAVRQLHFDVEIASDCRSQASVTNITDGNGNLIPGSLLPIYYLGGLEESIATNPFFDGVRSMLTGASTKPVFPALKRVHVVGDFIDPADPNRLPVGQTKGPDGRVEVEAHIEGLDQ